MYVCALAHIMSVCPKPPPLYLSSGPSCLFPGPSMDHPLPPLYPQTLIIFSSLLITSLQHPHHTSPAPPLHFRRALIINPVFPSTSITSPQHPYHISFASTSLHLYNLTNTPLLFTQYPHYISFASTEIIPFSIRSPQPFSLPHYCVTNVGLQNSFSFIYLSCRHCCSISQPRTDLQQDPQLGKQGKSAYNGALIPESLSSYLGP